MQTSYKIHPGIGIARLGNSDKFYLGPDREGGLPIEWDEVANSAKLDEGKPVCVSEFKDSSGAIKRQAAKFVVYVYDGESEQGRPLQAGDTIHGVGSKGKLVDIEWTVWLANKKSCWYQFEQLSGEHGYSHKHPLRNAAIDDATARQNLIINPGEQTIYNNQKPMKAQFARGQNPGQTQTFPPPLQPNSIDTLGEIFTNGDLGVYVLGAHGNSGAIVAEGEQATISGYANNDGWFDDISDGPVTARLVYLDEVDQEYRFAQVESPAWVIVAYPAYAPQIVNMITLDDVVYDMSVKNFALDTYLYGTAPFDSESSVTSAKDLAQWQAAGKQWNPDYYPYFYRDIWPILERPGNMQWVTTVLTQSLNPHNSSLPRSNFYVPEISQPPGPTDDPYQSKRLFIYNSLRKPGQENQATFRIDQQLFNSNNPDIGGDPTMDPYSRLYNAPLMPMLCGDNPISDTLSSKFLALTDTQLFMLRQWALGKFINEKDADLPIGPAAGQAMSGHELDRVALSGGLGGAFCPGGEVCWIIRNPQVFSGAYRINANVNFYPTMQTSQVSTTPGISIYNQTQLSLDGSITEGMEPGDLTKYSALPWQADFNECSSQDIEIGYDAFNKTKPKNEQTTLNTLWWPSHRPMQVQVPIPYDGDGASSRYLGWTRGISQDYAGDLKMVTAWSELGFLYNKGTPDQPDFLEQERKDPDIPAGKYISPPKPPSSTK